MEFDPQRGGAQPERALTDRPRILAFALLVAVLGLWQLLSVFGLLSPLFFPAPRQVLTTLWQMTITGELTYALAATLGRVLIGFGIGSAAGIIAGLLMGESRFLRAIFDPWVAALYPIPKIALFPVLVLFLGVGEKSKVAIIALAVFFLALINTMAGVRNISTLYFDVAQNYGARRWQVFRYVVVPGSLPMVFAGLRLALGMALLMAVAVELVTAREGLGALLWVSWETMRTDKLYATLLILSATGWGLNKGLVRLELWAIPWREDR